MSALTHLVGLLNQPVRRLPPDLDTSTRHAPGDPVPLGWRTPVALVATLATTIGLMVMLAAPAVPPLPVESETWSDTFGLGFGLTLVTAPVSALAFVVWFHRAYTNVSRWHVTSHRPSYVLWCWFVPYFALFRPPQMLREVLGNSSAVPAGNTQAVGLWWGMLLAGGLLVDGQVTALGGESVDDDVIVVAQAVGTACLVVAGATVMWIVWRASAAQRDRIERLANPQAPNPLLAGLA